MAIATSFVTTACGGALVVAAWCGIDKKRQQRAAEIAEGRDEATRKAI
jgi:hypothetical protein